MATTTPTLACELFPDVSRATTVSVCGPSVAMVVSQFALYGADTSSAPSETPSRLNCTPATATLSLAAALTATVPFTVA